PSSKTANRSGRAAEPVTGGSCCATSPSSTGSPTGTTGTPRPRTTWPSGEAAAGRSARWEQEGLRCDASVGDLAGQQGLVVLVAEVGPEQVEVERAGRIRAGAAGQGRYRDRVPGGGAGDEAPRRPAAEHEPVHVRGADGMRGRVHGLEATVDRYPSQAWQRRGELPERRRHAERPAQWMREHQAVQEAPQVVVLAHGFSERGAEGRTGEQGEGIAQAAEDQEVARRERVGD